jgi:hypothetical protein
MELQEHAGQPPLRDSQADLHCGWFLRMMSVILLRLLLLIAIYICLHIHVVVNKSLSAHAQMTHSAQHRLMSTTPPLLKWSMATGSHERLFFFMESATVNPAVAAHPLELKKVNLSFRKKS